MGRERALQRHGTESVSVIAGHAWFEDVMSLQDEDYLYLVMEYLAGGDVMVSSIPSLRACT